MGGGGVTSKLLLVSLFLFSVACSSKSDNPSGTGGEPAVKIKINFEVEGAGGTLALQKAGSSIAIVSGTQFDEGTKLQFTATPDAGKTVDTWKINDIPQSQTSSNFEYEVKASDAVLVGGVKTITVKVSFKAAAKITINFAVEGAGGTLALQKAGSSIAIVSGTQFDEGTWLMFMAMPNVAKTVDKWKINDVAQSQTSSIFEYEVKASDAVDVGGVKTTTVKVNFKAAAKIKINFAVEGAGGALALQKAGSPMPVSNGTEFDEGTWLMFMAMPNVAKTVDKWKINDVAQSQTSSNFEYEVKASDAVDVGGVKTITVKVSFKAAAKIKINFEVEGSGGSIVAQRFTIGAPLMPVSNGTEFDEGTKLNFTATPDTDKAVDKWKINDIPQSQTSSDFEYEVKASDAQIVGGVKTITVKVSFKAAAKITINFAVEGAGGTIAAQRMPGAAIATGDLIEEGAKLQFTATPELGKILDKWKLNEASQSETFQSFDYIVSPADAQIVGGTKTITVKVSFKVPEKITINFAVEGSGGTLKATKDGTEFTSGAQFDEDTYLTFAATPDSGKIVDKWKMNNATQSAITSLWYVVKASDAVLVGGVKTITVKVSFKVPEKITINFAVEGSGGTLKATKDGTEFTSGTQFDEGTHLTFAATPASGKIVDKWKMNDAELFNPAPVPTYSYTIHPADAQIVGGIKTITVKVSFRDAEKIKINFEVEGADGTIAAKKIAGAAITTGNLIEEKTVLQFTATPASGKIVDKWKMNGTDLLYPNAIYNYTINPADAMNVGGTKTITVKVSFKASP